MKYKHKQTGLIAVQNINTESFFVDKFGINLPSTFIENTNDWELIPEQKYKAGDWVKAEDSEIYKIIKEDGGGYICHNYKANVTIPISQYQIKCKVKPIIETVSLYYYESYYVSKFPNIQSPHKLIDSKKVTFYEEIPNE